MFIIINYIDDGDHVVEDGVDVVEAGVVDVDDHHHHHHLHHIPGIPLSQSGAAVLPASHWWRAPVAATEN